MLKRGTGVGAEWDRWNGQTRPSHPWSPARSHLVAPFFFEYHQSIGKPRGALPASWPSRSPRP